MQEQMGEAPEKGPGPQLDVSFQGGRQGGRDLLASLN